MILKAISKEELAPGMVLDRKQVVSKWMFF